MQTVKKNWLTRENGTHFVVLLNTGRVIDGGPDVDRVGRDRRRTGAGEHRMMRMNTGVVLAGLLRWIDSTLILQVIQVGGGRYERLASRG